MDQEALNKLLPFDAVVPPLRIVEGGAVRVGKGRMTLDLVVEEYESGMTPEDMVRAYDTLNLADVYATIAYYLSHRDAIREYMKRREVEAAVLRAEIEARQPRISREVLLSRRAAKENANAATGAGGLAMSSELMHDRGRGPEIVGTRITVYNLLPYFLDPTVTEDSIVELYNLTAEQVAAARAYALNNAEAVLKRHAEIEARMAAGNPPGVIEKLQRSHGRFLQFKEWAVRRAEAQARDREGVTEKAAPGSRAFPTFQEWLAQQPSQTAERP